MIVEGADGVVGIPGEPACGEQSRRIGVVLVDDENGIEATRAIKRKAPALAWVAPGAANKVTDESAAPAQTQASAVFGACQRARDRQSET